jgi:hypothetical protein
MSRSGVCTCIGDVRRLARLVEVCPFLASRELGRTQGMGKLAQQTVGAVQRLGLDELRGK